MANSPGGINVATRGPWAERLADAVGTEGAPLDRLLTASAEELLDAQLSLQFAGGTIDGTVVTRHPVDAISERGAAGVPLVVGTNLDEGTLFTLPMRDRPELLEATVRSLATQITRDGDVESYLDALDARFPDDDAFTRANRVWVDLFRRTAVEAAAAATQAGPGGWLYRLDLPTTLGGDALGATHSADVTLTFNWLASERPMGYSLYDREDPTAIDLAQRWSDTILAFARTGDPNGAGLPEWPRYSADDRACLVLDTTTEIRDDPDGPDRQRWR